jgi:hypothetical protein
MMIKKLFSFCVIALLGLAPLTEAFAAKPLALVWYGPGACKPGCAAAAAVVAKQAGFRVQKIYPGFKNYTLFKEAKLWVQPGGKSVDSAAAMGPELMDQVRNFVYNGGGYVGFCAGLFITTAQIGTSGKVGYGIVPGSTELHLKNDPPGLLLPITTAYGVKNIYYAGGPELNISDADLKAAHGEIIAKYADGKTAGVKLEYGKGKIAVVGVHPEAGFWWKIFKGIIDRDGSDRWFALDMIKYATGSSVNSVDADQKTVDVSEEMKELQAVPQATQMMSE